MNINYLIDYDLQFSKSFEEPLKALVDVIGWRLNREKTLEEIFAE